MAKPLKIAAPLRCFADTFQREETPRAAVFLPGEIAGNSQKISLESASFRIELLHLPRAYCIENHHKNLLCKLFGRRNGSSHVYQKPIDGTLMQVIKLHKGALISLPQTLA